MDSVLSIVEKGQNEDSYKSVFTPKDDSLLIIAAMALPFSQIHYLCNFEVDYTSNALLTHFIEILKHPLTNVRISKNKTIIVPWSTEEDFWIYCIRNHKELESSQFLQILKSKINPTRSKREIKKRIERIRDYDEESITELINKMSDIIITDKIIAEICTVKDSHTIVSEYKCKKREDKVFPFGAHSKIIHLAQQTPDIADQYFNGDEIAILTTENLLFRLKKQYNVIGYTTPSCMVDVDLKMFIDVECYHISAKQAIIYLLDDCNFYIENIGMNIFRVNGIIIPPTKCCYLPFYSIIDFADNLFMFIPNLKLLNNIYRIYQQKLVSAGKQESEQPVNESDDNDNDISIAGINLPNKLYISDPFIL